MTPSQSSMQSTSQDQEVAFGRFLIERGVVSPEQAREGYKLLCGYRQTHPSVKFLHVLAKHEFASKEALRDAFQAFQGGGGSAPAPQAQAPQPPTAQPPSSRGGPPGFFPGGDAPADDRFGYKTMELDPDAPTGDGRGAIPPTIDPDGGGGGAIPPTIDPDGGWSENATLVGRGGPGGAGPGASGPGASGPGASGPGGAPGFGSGFGDPGGSQGFGGQQGYPGGSGFGDPGGSAGFGGQQGYPGGSGFGDPGGSAGFGGPQGFGGPGFGDPGGSAGFGGQQDFGGQQGFGGQQDFGGPGASGPGASGPGGAPGFGSGFGDPGGSQGFGGQQGYPGGSGFGDPGGSAGFGGQQGYPGGSGFGDPGGSAGFGGPQGFGGPGGTNPVGGPGGTSPIGGPGGTSPIGGPGGTSPIGGPGGTSPVGGPGGTSPFGLGGTSPQRGGLDLVPDDDEDDDYDSEEEEEEEGGGDTSIQSTMPRSRKRRRPLQPARKAKSGVPFPVLLGVGVGVVLVVALFVNSVLEGNRLERLRGEFFDAVESGEAQIALDMAEALPPELLEDPKVKETLEALRAEEAQSGAREQAEAILAQLDNAQDLDRRRQICDEAIGVDDTFARAYVARARVNFALAKRDAVGGSKSLEELIQPCMGDLLVALSKEPNSPEALLFRARLLLMTGKRREALSDFAQAHKLDPDGAIGALAQGYQEMIRDNYTRAVEFFSRAIERDHRRLEGYLARARASIALGDYPRASADANEAVQRDRSSSEALTLLAEARYHGSDERDAALLDLNRAIELDPSNAHAYALRAYARLERDRIGDLISAEADRRPAREDAEQALEIDSSEYLAHLALAEITHASGRANSYDAINKATFACEAASNQPLPFLVRGRLRAKAGDTDNAESDFERVLQLTENRSGSETIRARALTMKATVLVNRKNFDDALTALDDALELDNGLPEAYFQRGLVYYKRDLTQPQYQTALQDFSEAINRKTDFADAYFYRACIYLDMGRGGKENGNPDMSLFDNSLDDLERAEGLMGDGVNFFNDVGLYMLRGHCYFELEDWRGALDAYGQYQEEAPVGHKAYDKIRRRMEECQEHLTNDP